VRPISREWVTAPELPTPAHHDPKAAVTDGSLRPAYAQFVVDPDTHITVIRIHDAGTGQVISETPSPEVQQMTETLQKYADAQAHHQASLHTDPEV
jgi:hypothetical protein